MQVEANDGQEDIDTFRNLIQLLRDIAKQEIGIWELVPENCDDICVARKDLTALWLCEFEGFQGSISEAEEKLDQSNSTIENAKSVQAIISNFYRWKKLLDLNNDLENIMEVREQARKLAVVESLRALGVKCDPADENPLRGSELTDIQKYVILKVVADRYKKINQKLFAKLCDALFDRTKFSKKAQSDAMIELQNRSPEILDAANSSPAKMVQLVVVLSPKENLPVIWRDAASIAVKLTGRKPIDNDTRVLAKSLKIYVPPRPKAGRRKSPPEILSWLQ